jgi:SulP family sulfate permease
MHRMRALARPGAWREALPAITVLGLLNITFIMSNAALVFEGRLDAAYPAGLGCLLLGTAVGGAILGLRSGLQPQVAATQGATAAILAASLAPLGRQLEDEAALAATAPMALLFVSLATALAFGVLGYGRLGRLVRFLPFPVVAGFLTASGWLTLTGGLRVSSGVLHISDVSDLTRLPHLGAAIAGGAALLVAQQRLKGAYVLPMMIIGGILLHHVVAGLVGADIAVQRTTAWLPDLPDRLPPPPLWDPAALAAADWRVLAQHLVDLPMLVLVAALGLMMNIGAMEAATKRDANIDRELRISAQAAAASGALGGLFAALTVDRTMLIRRIGGHGPAAVIGIALATGLVPFLLPGLLELVPRWLLGALLLLVGSNNLQRWALSSRAQVTPIEWAQVLAVAATVIIFGSMIGLLAGLLLACGHFMALYGRASPLRARYDGSAAESDRARPDEDRAALRATGSERIVLHLQGFLFFGTANKVLERVRAELAGPERRTHLLLDFQEVVGLDSSVALIFARLREIAVPRGVTLVLTGVTPEVAAGLGTLATDTTIRRFPVLRDGLEWVEDDALSRLPPRSAPPSFLERIEAAMGPEDAARFLTALPERSVPEGTVLMVQGEASDHIVLIESGTVDVEVRFGEGQALHVTVDVPGTLLGEIGFLLGLPRSATVRTLSPCRLRRLSRDDLARLHAEAPEVGRAFQDLLAQLLAARIVDKDRTISGLVRGMRQIAS